MSESFKFKERTFYFNTKTRNDKHKRDRAIMVRLSKHSTCFLDTKGGEKKEKAEKIWTASDNFN